MALVGDERGQAIQIGAVLLFAVLIVSFSTYQAFIVPNQNRQVEFNHNQQVQRDMVEVRNTLLETYTGGDNGFAEVTLGTNYPARLVATNPGPPAGSLRTTDSRAYTITNLSSDTDITAEVCPGSNFDTRFLEYEPSYSVYQGAGTLRYENTLLYHDFGSNGGTELTDQVLVRDETIQLIPITSDLSVGGTQTESIEPKAGRVDRTQVQNVEISLPTTLSEDRWESILEDDISDDSKIAVTGSTGSRTLELTLDDSQTWTLVCGPVGLGEVPDAGDRRSGVDDINPASPGEIRLNEEIKNGNNLTLRFQNDGDDNEFIEARINFYQTEGAQSPNRADIREVNEPVSGTLDIRGDFVKLDPDISLQGDGTVTDVKLEFDSNLKSNAWFVLTIQIESGETAVYFVPVP